MEILKLLMGPLIGAVIGYFTNYIAVKMLFRPREPKFLFGRQLPMTPGAIPKGKERLARAAGDVVSNYLVTPEDIGSKFLSESAEDMVVDKVMTVLRKSIREDLAIVSGTGNNYVKITGKIDDIVTDKIVETVSNLDVDAILNSDIKRAIMQRLSGTLVGVFVRENTIDSLLSTLGREAVRYVREHGNEVIKPIVTEKMSDLRSESPIDLASGGGADEARVREMIAGAYRAAITQGLPNILRRVNISGTIEEKINAMSSEELEKLVLEVMSKELGLIVNLGAVIGFVIGWLNVLVQQLF